MVGRAEVAHVNLPVAVLIWLMIIPMPAKMISPPSDRGPACGG